MNEIKIHGLSADSLGKTRNQEDKTRASATDYCRDISDQQHFTEPVPKNSSSMSITTEAWYVRAGEQLQEPALFLDYVSARYFIVTMLRPSPESKALELSADPKNPE